MFQVFTSIKVNEIFGKKKSGCKPDFFFS